MILVADSGSTKCAWGITENRKTRFFETSGINPTTQERETIFQRLNVADLKKCRKKRGRLFFYCSGGKNKKEVLTEYFKEFFGNTLEIRTESDVLGAARAAFGKKKGIICILGTGSSSGYFDGTKIIEQRGGLGYLLGDESGGVHLGKMLVLSYLKKSISRKAQNFLEEKHNFSSAFLLKQVYKNKNAPVFFSKCSIILNEARKEFQELETIIILAFQAFLKETVLPLVDSYDEKKISFVGSISNECKDIFSPILKRESLILENVFHKPIQKLHTYHLVLDNHYE